MHQKYNFSLFFAVLLAVPFAVNCAHYPVNPPLEHYSPETGYRLKKMGVPGNSGNLLLILSFSGGGTRAAAFSYGVLEELARTEVNINSRKRRMIDEVDIISAVSGGSFTAAYYGLFGDRIFKDFESYFLKKDIQGALIIRQFFFLHNWFRLFSPNFANNDMAAEYYDKYVFEGGTFGDIASQEGPAIIINATDMTEGVTFPFEQEMFDLICSDLSGFPVARAVAASSAVPVVLSPITLRNYAGKCGYAPDWIRDALKERDISPRRYYQAVHTMPYLDISRKRYVHLLDGGIADNLGFRVVIDRIIELGDAWNSLKNTGMENTHKVVFVVVNAETEVDMSPDMSENPPGPLSVLRSVTTTSLSRYSIETLELLKLNFKLWAEDIRSGRCNDPDFKDHSDSCDDIEFYLVEVDFDALPDESERTYLKSLPTSFTLPAESVDALRGAAHRILKTSKEFQRLLGELK